MRSQQLTEKGLIFGQSARASGRNVLERLKSFEALCPFPDGLAADLGCGQGGYAIELAKRFDRVIGVDILLANVEYARLQASGNVEFCCAPLEDIPLESGTVDAAFLIEVLDHVTDVEKSLAELKRILKARSTAYVSVPNALFPLETHPVKISGRFFHPCGFRS